MSDARHDNKVHRAGTLVLAGLAAGVALSACVSRAPAPVQLEAYPDQRAASRPPTPPDGRAWTAADLLARAARLNPAVAEARARRRTALASAKAAKVSPQIGLTLTAEYARAESKHWLYGAGADIPLDTGARRAERFTAADLAALRAGYDYAEALWSARAALTRARTERLFADQEIGLAREIEAVRQARADRIDQRVAAGEDERARALAARGELNAAHRRVSESLGRRAAADAALAGALGLPVSAARDLPLAAPNAVSPDPDLAAAARVAALTRTEILRAVVDYDLAESALRLEIARQRPDIRVGPGYAYDHGLVKLPFNLALTLPPRDLNRAAIAAAEAKRAEAGRSLEAAQGAVLSAIDAAQTALATAQVAARRIQTHALPNADALAESTARSVKAGAADRVDELAARAAALEARLDLIDALKAEALARADLEDALRAPFDPAERALLETLSRTLGDDDDARR